MLQLCVLVVDDYPDAADSLALLIRLWGHVAHVAYDGPTALALAASAQPHVVLLDIGLPGTDGCRVAHQLRQQARATHARVIAVTGYGDREHRARGHEAGLDEYLLKPVDPTILQQILKEESARRAALAP